MKARKYRISFVRRVIALFMAVYLFNFSIDSRDAKPDTEAEDLSINDIESVYEFLAEGLLGVENAVEEHDERDQDDGGSFEFKKFYFTELLPTFKVRGANLSPALRYPSSNSEALIIRATEIHSPPPRA